jgi:hypothetical protein
MLVSAGRELVKGVNGVVKSHKKGLPPQFKVEDKSHTSVTTIFFENP